jgi:hypothetical protein
MVGWDVAANSGGASWRIAVILGTANPLMSDDMQLLDISSLNRTIKASIPPRIQSIYPWYKPFFNHCPSISLFAFSDPVATTTVTCAVVESNAPEGNSQEASDQIAVALAAILGRVRLLDCGSDGAEEGMPVV